MKAYKDKPERRAVVLEEDARRTYFSISSPLSAIEELKRIPTGEKAARRYQEHVRYVLELLFPEELRDLRLEQDVFGRIKRLDILAYNKSRSGFFYSLKEDHQVYCPTIVIECKNYEYELRNPEFDQLGARLGVKLGMFGILAFRMTEDRKKVLQRCRAFFDNDKKIILPMNDSDFEQLIMLKIQSRNEEIERYLDRLLLEIKAG
jgi:hypothetical protein